MQHQGHTHPLALVCVAAPEDESLLAHWETHLSPLQQAGLLTCWSKRHLTAGLFEEHTLKEQLDQADLILLLLSADFFASPECLAAMEHALQRARKKATCTIPLLLRPCAWQESPLNGLVCWPSNGTPLTRWVDQEEGWDACVRELRRLLGRRVSERLSSERADTHADRDWERMLRRLRRSYKDLLDQSLHGIAWVDLGLAEHPDLVSNVTNLLFRLPQGGERLLAPGTRVLDAYDEAEGELLILGAPGAGKSTLLVDLAQQLVGRAFIDQRHPLPVILRLSSWAVHRPALDDWMIEQLSQTYDVPRKLSERWVKEGRLLPLLDGLDEMEEAARPACIAAINGYHRTHLTPLIACSRQAEYEVAAKRAHIALQSAVVVQPLSNEQIEGYLDAAGPSFAGVRTAMHEQQALWELATTPLMLSVLLLTYRGVSSEEIGTQATDLEQQVWTDYIARQVHEKGNETRYPLERTRIWLAFLAQQLRMHQQTTFYAEHLDINWLPKAQQRAVTRFAMLIPSIMIGVCVSILASIFTVFYTDTVFLLEMGVFGAFVGGCLSSSVIEKPAESGGRLQIRILRRFRNAILLGICIAASLGFLLNPPFYDVREWWKEGFILGLGSVLSAWAFQAILDQQKASVSHQYLDLQDSPETWMNSTIPLSLWQATAVLGIGIALSYGLRYGLSYSLSDGLSAGLSIGLSDGMSVSVTVILVHLILDASLRTLRFVERIHWTWRSLFRTAHLRTASIVTAIAFLFYGVRFGLSLGLSIGLPFGLSDVLSIGLYQGLNYGLSYGLSLGLMYWLLLGFYQGMTQEHLENQCRFQFNQGIRRSMLYGFLISLISAILITMMGWFSYGLSAGLNYGLDNGLRDWLRFGLSSGLSDGLSYGLGYGLISGLRFGLNAGLIMLLAGIAVMWALSGGLTILRHYVIRWSLARHRTFPFRAAAFLDDATSRILMRRVGGGYSFIHRRLQDYFAATALPHETSGEREAQ